MKHGNWNQRPHLHDPVGIQRERRDRQFAAIETLARRLFDLVVDSDLSDGQQDTAVAMFNLFWSRMRDK